VAAAVLLCCLRELRKFFFTAAVALAVVAATANLWEKLVLGLTANLTKKKRLFYPLM